MASYLAQKRLVTPLWSGLAILWSSGVVFAGSLRADVVQVFGWPVPSLVDSKPSLGMGDDPVFGRLACPPISRINLSDKNSEPLIIRQAVEEFGNERSESLWRIEMRTGIHWWSGPEVTSSDLAQFVEKSLAAVVKERGNGLWTTPAFTTKVESAQYLTVSFKSPPKFGPYIFNGVSLWRKAEPKTEDGLSYECAGLYRPELRDYGAILIPTEGYKYPRPGLEMHEKSAVALPKTRSVSFRYANSYGGHPDHRLSDDKASCAQQIDLPLVTLISWNTQEGPTAEKDFRVLMTTLMPRGALLRSGAASLGELVSSPIPRVHPGYNSKVLVRPFDISAVSAGLEKLGFNRKRADGPRHDRAGQPLRLRIGTTVESSGLVEKVISDAFASVGISVKFELDVHDMKELSGVLSGVALEWPRADFLANFHSKSAAVYPFWPLADVELDRNLEAYALSLTTARPDFALLQLIHQKLYELEPLTVLMQHKACLDVSQRQPKPASSLVVLDPDWFRRLVM